jgi:hypothetical protein
LLGLLFEFQVPLLCKNGFERLLAGGFGELGFGGEGTQVRVVSDLFYDEAEL